jgi:ribosomal protein S8E
MGTQPSKVQGKQEHKPKKKQKQNLDKDPVQTGLNPK